MSFMLLSSACTRDDSSSGVPAPDDETADQIDNTDTASDEDALLETACELAPPEDIDPRADVSFESDHMPCIELTIDAADWESLGQDSWAGSVEDAWDTFDELAGQCSEPWPNEYPWYEADLVADGVALGQIGIRRKGFLGSFYSDRPALKLKTDKWVDDQFIGNTERITLNNNAGDSTHVAACLTYEVYAMADYPAPRCNLASVWVNGQPYGTYTHIEALKVRFLERAFGDAGGSLYEGVGTDFVEDWVTRFEAKTDDTDTSFAPLVAVAQALTVPDDELIEALEPLVNLDRFVTFWALEVAVNHTDAYGSARNNYFVYFDPSDGDRAVLVPWGVDKLPTYDDLPLDSHLYAELARRLSQDTEMAARMEAELTRIAAEVWDTDTLLESITRLRSHAETAPWEGDPADVDAEVAALRAWVTDRPEVLAALASPGIPQGAEDAAECLSGDDGGGGGGDTECPSDFDSSASCEDGEKCTIGDVWWYCDGGVWYSW